MGTLWPRRGDKEEPGRELLLVSPPDAAQVLPMTLSVSPIACLFPSPGGRRTEAAKEKKHKITDKQAARTERVWLPQAQTRSFWKV